MESFLGQETAIRTDRPGLIGCTVAQDVWSDDGTTLLVRKGAMAKGEQRDAVIVERIKAMLIKSTTHGGHAL
jgi:type IV secretory pathway VirB10-like protein